MQPPRWLTALRSWILARFSITTREGREGHWWEVDFLLVFFAGIVCLGLLALARL